METRTTLGYIGRGNLPRDVRLLKNDGAFAADVLQQLLGIQGYVEVEATTSRRMRADQYSRARVGCVCCPMSALDGYHVNGMESCHPGNKTPPSQALG